MQKEIMKSLSMNYESWC